MNPSIPFATPYYCHHRHHPPPPPSSSSYYYYSQYMNSKVDRKALEEVFTEATRNNATITAMKVRESRTRRRRNSSGGGEGGPSLPCSTT